MSCKGVQLVIKNIPLNVDDKNLREIFEEIGEVLELKIKTYGWFEQKHAFVHYATKKHAENAFKKLNDFSLGSNKIKAIWIETEIENSNGVAKNNKTSSHDFNASAIADQKLRVNSKINPTVQDNKVKSNSEPNPEIHFNPKAQNDCKANPKVQDDSKANPKVQDDSRANPKMQDNSKAIPKMQDNSKANSKVQDDSEANPKVQDDSKMQVDSKAIPKMQDNSKANLKVQDDSKESSKVQDDSKANSKIQADSKTNPRIQDESKAKAITNPNSISEERRNVYVSGLSQNVSESILKAEFEKHAKVESVTILKPSKWKSDCNHGYVTLDSNQSAEKVIYELNQTLICGKIITVNWANDIRDIGCIYISGLPLNVSEDELRKQLEQYGRLQPQKINLLKSAEKDEQHTYVRYVSQESAKKAVQAINWSRIFGKTLTVILKNDIECAKEIEKELFVQGLPFTTDKVSIREVFEKYGEVTFVKISRGYFETYGFVRFLVKDSAEKALVALNGKTLFGKAIHVSWATERKRLLKNKPGSSSKIKHETTKSFKSNSVGKLKRQVEAGTFVPRKVGGDGSKQIKTNSFGRGRGQCRPNHQPPSRILGIQTPPPGVQCGPQHQPPSCIVGIQTPPPNIQTTTQSCTDKNFSANVSVNHRFSSIVHKYSAMVTRPLSQEAVSGIKYVLEVSLKGDLENLVTCLRRVTKLRASVDDNGKDNRTKDAVEGLASQLGQTLKAVDWTKLASFYNKTVACARAETKMTDADILSKLRKEEERISEAEGSVNELTNHLRSIVLAFEDVEECNEVKTVLNVELHECLEKAQECLDYPDENKDEDMIVWGKNKVEEILDEIDSAWNIVQEDSDVMKLLNTMGNPLCLFEKKDSVKNKKIVKPKSADLNENNSLLRNKVQQHFQSNKSKGGCDDSNNCPREKKRPIRLDKNKTIKFKSAETGYIQVQEIKTLVEALSKQNISPPMKHLLGKLDRDQDGWIFYDEFEAALTPDLLNILGKK